MYNGDMRKAKIGDIGLYSISGPLGWIISIGQAAVGDGSKYTHAFIITDQNEVLAAQPRGARYDPLHIYYGRSAVLDVPLTDLQRALIVENARKLEGVKYGFSGYLYIILSAFNIRPKWLVNYVTNNGRMICSQLVDFVYAQSGVHLFDDGRQPFDVTPGDLADLIWKDYKLNG